MKHVAFAIILVVTAVLIRAEIKILPKYIVPCKAKDGVCLKNLLEELAPRLNLGIPELNVPSFDPLDLPDCNASDSSPDMLFTGYVKHMEYRGASNFKVSKFDVDLEGLTFNLVVFFPHLAMRGYEIVWAKGFGMEVNGEGFVTENYSNVTISFSLKGTRYTGKENKPHVKWTEGLISVSVGGSSFDVESSFTDANYQVLLDKANRDHGDAFGPLVERYIKITLADFLLKILNTVHEIFPVDVLYLPEQINLV